MSEKAQVEGMQVVIKHGQRKAIRNIVYEGEDKEQRNIELCGETEKGETNLSKQAPVV